MFNPNDRVELATSDIKGIVEKDDGQYVWVKWDDGQTGILEYSRDVCYNAYRLMRLKHD